MYNRNMNILQRILKDHFTSVVSTGIEIRDTVYENVNKAVNCGDWRLGFAEFRCGCCGDVKRVPFRCKSRFCTICGNLYNICRANSMQLKLFKCRHRHCVFTIPEELRPFFVKTARCSTVFFTLFAIPSCICSAR